MSTEDIGGEEMDRRAAAEFLHERGTGVLSLADGGEAYGFPISYGYDGDREVLYFAFLRSGEHSKKEAFAGTTERATLTTYAVESPGEWESVVASGPIRTVESDEYERATDAIQADAWYPNLFRESSPTRGVEVYAMDVEELTGRRGGE